MAGRTTGPPWEEEWDPDPVTRWHGTVHRHAAPGAGLAEAPVFVLDLACGQEATCRWRVAARKAVADRIAAVLVWPCRSRVGTAWPLGGGRGRRRLVIVGDFGEKINDERSLSR